MGWIGDGGHFLEAVGDASLVVGWTAMRDDGFFFGAVGNASSVVGWTAVNGEIMRVYGVTFVSGVTSLIPQVSMWAVVARDERL